MRSLAFALLATSALAADSLYFDGPEVVKLDWNTACPRSADFNGDGLTDIVVINQDRARIEFLLQRKDGVLPGEPERSSRTDRWNPILEVSRFYKQPLVIGHSAFALTVGDWNGDKRPDIAFVTDEDKLILRTQGAKAGDWTQKKEFILDSTAQDTESLISADLNADGKADLALLTNTRLMIWLQCKEGWAEPKSYVLGQPGCGGMRTGDLNGDGKADLFYTAPDADAVLVRLQQDAFSFGEEWRLETETSRCWAHPMKLGKDAKATGLAYIHDTTGMIEVAKLATGEVEPNADRAASIRYAMPASDAKGGAVAFGDLNGDGISDVVLTEAKNARLWFFAGGKDGSFREGREFPALSGIETITIADVDGDSKAELIVLSPGEKSIGLARWQKDRLAYPEVVYQSTDTLLTLTTGNVTGDKTTAILALAEVKSKVSLVSLKWSAADKKFIPTTQELISSPSKPNAIRVVDANQDGRGDLALFSTLVPMQILLSQTDAKAPFKRAEGLPDSLVNKLTPVALTAADVNGDDKAEIIVAKDQLARAFLVGADGKAVTVEQFNAPDSSSQLSAVFVTKTAEGKARVLLADSAQKKLHEMSSGTDGVFRATHTHALSSLSAEQLHLLGDKLLVIGKTSFDLTPLSGSALRLETIVSFDSELKDTKPSDLIPAAFSGLGSDDLALVDFSASRVLEFFQPTEKTPAEWQSAMYFSIFETDPHFRGKSGRENEPHDYTALDLNTDGKLDLALLVHDRLLIYVRK
jgi:hypothetical protein